MKNSMVWIILSLSLFMGCSQQLDNPGEAGQTQGTAFSSPYTVSELNTGAYIGGALYYREGSALNQLKAGMIIRLRLERVDSYDPAQTIHVETGVLRIRSIHAQELRYDIILLDNQGREVVNRQDQVLLQGQSVSLNRDNVADISFTDSHAIEAEHPQFQGGYYLDFLSYQDKKIKTLYMLLAYEYPAGEFPLGLSGMNDSGEIIIQTSLPASSSAYTTNFGLSITNVIEDAVYELDALTLPEVVAGDYLVNREAGISYLILSVSQTGGKKKLTVRSMPERTPFELMYLNIKGNARDLKRQYDSGQAVSPTGTASTLGDSVGTSINLFSYDRTIHLLTNESVSIVLYNYGSMDLFVEAGYNTGWFFVSGYVESQVILQGAFKIRADFSAVRTWDRSITLATPYMGFAIGPVPVSISMPIRVGVEVEVGCAGYAQVGFDYYASAGSRTEVSLGTQTYVKRTPLNNFVLDVHPLEVSLTGWAKVTPYLSLSPTLSVAGILHAGLEIRPYIEGKLEGNVTYTPSLLTGSLDFDVTFGLRLSGFAAIGVRWLDLYKEWDLGVIADIRRNLYHWGWSTDQESPVSLNAPGGLSAVPDNDQGSVSLLWNPVNLASGYYIRRSDGTNTVEMYTRNVAYTDTRDLRAGIDYTYTVVAVNGTVLSAPSSGQTVSFTPPPAPSGVNATSVPNGNIQLTWTPVPGILSYEIVRTSAGLPDRVYYAQQPPFENSGLETNRVYSYSIRSVNWTGSSTNSQADTASPLLPGTPAAPTVYGLTTMDVTLQWGAVSGAHEYRVIRTLDGTNAGRREFFTSSLRFTDNTIASDTTYYYRVAAVNYAGLSPQSAALPVQTASTNAPQVVVTQPNNNLGLAYQFLTVKGKAFTGGTIPADKVFLRVDNGSWLVSIVSNTGDFFCIISNVGNVGSHELSIYAKDSHGKIGITNKITFQTISISFDTSYEVGSFLLGGRVTDLYYDPIGYYCWLIDDGGCRVIKTTSSMTFSQSFGSQGTANNQFGNNSGYGPSALTVASGNIYISDFANLKMKEFTTSGTFVSSANSGEVFDVAKDPQDHVYTLTESGVVKYSTALQSPILIIPLSSSIETVFYGGYHGGLTINNLGEIFVRSSSDNLQVQKYDNSGTLLNVFNLPYQLHYMESASNFIVCVQKIPYPRMWLMDFYGNYLGELPNTSTYFSTDVYGMGNISIAGNKIAIMNNGNIGAKKIVVFNIEQ